MNISEKIEGIRREPQHIRMRYVWGCVALSMLLIIVIWFFSIAQMLHVSQSASEQNTSNVTDLKNQLQAVTEQQPSPTTQQQAPPTGSEGIGTSQNSTDFQYPANGASAQTPQTNQTTQAPQSPAYNQQ